MFKDALKAPIVIDVNGKGLHLKPVDQSGVYANWAGGAFASRTSWIGDGTGFLVLMPAQGGAPSLSSLIGGFPDLAKMDTNHDGVLTASETAFARFAVWQDFNFHGVAEANEITLLSGLEFSSLEVNAHTVNDRVRVGVI